MSNLTLGNSLILDTDTVVGGSEVKTGATYLNKPVFRRSFRYPSLTITTNSTTWDIDFGTTKIHRAWLGPGSYALYKSGSRMYVGGYGYQDTQNFMSLRVSFEELATSLRLEYWTSYLNGAHEVLFNVEYIKG